MFEAGDIFYSVVSSMTQHDMVGPKWLEQLCDPSTLRVYTGVAAEVNGQGKPGEGTILECNWEFLKNQRVADHRCKTYEISGCFHMLEGAEDRLKELQQLHGKGVNEDDSSV